MTDYMMKNAMEADGNFWEDESMTNKENPAKPTYSKGASQAALKILADQFGVEAAALDIGSDTHRRWSQIIHNETRQEAQQELLELADEAMSVLTTSNEVYAYKLGRKIQAAIAKVEEQSK